MYLCGFLLNAQLKAMQSGPGLCFTGCVLTLFLLVSCRSYEDSFGNTDGERDSLDSPAWAGTYRGILPCSDCGGIQMQIILKPDNSFQKMIRYLGTGTDVYTTSGTIEWDSARREILLNNVDESRGPNRYAIGENAITQLNVHSRRHAGPNADSFHLIKQQVSLLNNYWKLIQVNDMTVTPAEGQRAEPHIVLHQANKRLTGHGGCNSLSGTYTIKGDSIAFSGIVSTRMMCYEMSTEMLFMNTIKEVNRYRITGDTLRVFKSESDGAAVFVFDYFK
jgi:copper homeostasis protein (lipoprotein)